MNSFQSQAISDRNFAGRTFLFCLILITTLFMSAGCSRDFEEDVGSEFGLDKRPSNSGCVAPDRPASGVDINLKRVFAGINLTLPVAMIQAPRQSNIWYVVEQGGKIKRFDKSDSGNFTLFGDLHRRIVGGGEKGLLGMAFHPQFPTKPQVYLSYVGGQKKALISTISAFTVSSEGLILEPGSEKIILQVKQPFGNHNGGHIAFGRDGYLYIGLGDGGSGGDPLGHGQNTKTLLGSMLRIDVDNGNPYAIPPTNPFINGGGKKEIYAYGLRNPWRWSFDRETGELWLGDVGQKLWEEINKVSVGGNYGWNLKEGFHCYLTDPCDTPGLLEPVVEYSHDEGCSVTGGYVYRGNDIPSLQGIYIYSDFCSGNIWGILYDKDGKAFPRLLEASGRSISSFAQGDDGELYLLSYRDGVILKMAPASGGQPKVFPGKLSETGCVDPSDPKRICDCFIPYDMNVSFWSDGAGKKRWFLVPEGRTLAVEGDGHIAFPEGSILIKEFSFQGRLIETRLFIRHLDGGWAGYSYEWDDAQTDATLLPAGKIKQVNGQAWVFPSRAQCLQCHTAAAGRSLGPEIAQLNRPNYYPTTQRTANQLKTLNFIGLFDPPLNEDPQNLTAFAGLNDNTAPVEQRARAYLHANCGNCHRPESSGRGDMDFRFQVSLADTKICDVLPVLGNLGIADARLLAPGDPGRSIILKRMEALDFSRMPPIGSKIRDDQGIALIRQWIFSLTSCR